MKLETAYAQALFESLKGKDGHERDSLVKKFFALIEQKGHKRLLSKIAYALERIEKKEKDQHTTLITVAPKAHLQIEKDIVSELEKHTGKKSEYVVCEDESVIGGFTAKAYDLRIDASYKRALLTLWDKLRV